MTRQIFFDLVVARSLNRGIGVQNKIPWRLPNDLKMFKKITRSGIQKNFVIMGRKTFDSIGRKALTGRTNVVISQNSRIEENENIKQVGSFHEAIQLANHLNPRSKIFVIGGQKVFQEALPDCRFIYQTIINKEFNCQVFFPEHNFPCKFISKTMKQNNLTYDYRIFRNPSKHLTETLQNLFDCPEHEEYQYLRMVENIIENGEEKIDRTGTGTNSIFGGMMKYDLKDTFPLLTHKKVFWRGVAQQLLWFVKGETDAKLLQDKKIHIWDGNSSKQYLQSVGINRQQGDLGPVYGFQWRHWNAPYTAKEANYKGKGIDQLQWILDEIKRNPSSRRLIMTAWNPEQLKDMALPPCHLLSQFYVTNSNRLSCILYQRSCDMGLGVPFNIASYALLTCMIAQVVGLERGQFVHMMADMHVYKDHIQSLRGLSNIQPHPFPTLSIDPSIKNIQDFQYKHFQLNDYKSHKKIQMKMSV